MNDPLVVRRLQGQCDLPANLQRFLEAERPTSQNLRERFALDELEDEEVDKRA